MKRALFVFSLLGALIIPTFASAQSVMVLGMRSVEGDDEFARNLTGALRHAASSVDGWDVSDREVTLSQMALVHGCDDPNPTCLAEIASSLEAEIIIYGDVRRTSAGSDYDFSVNLHHFDNRSGDIEHSVADTIASVHQDIDDLREPSRRWIASLSGAPRSGTLLVHVNVPGAEVFVDGSSVGVVDDGGDLRVEEVESGTRQVRVTAEGHAEFTSSVSVEPYAEATLEGELQLGGGGGGGGEFPVDLVVGGALLVVAAGMAAGWIYSGASVFFRNGGEDWRGTEGPDGRLTGGVRGRYSDTVQNLCTETGGMPDEISGCDEAATLEVLQFVFAGLTAVAGGVGLYFLISGASGGDDDAAADEASIELVPSLSPERAYLGARVRF